MQVRFDAVLVVLAWFEVLMQTADPDRSGAGFFGVLRLFRIASRAVSEGPRGEVRGGQETGQTSEGSFSAVSTPILGSIYLFRFFGFRDFVKEVA